MRGIWNFLADSRTLTVLAFLLASAVLLLSAHTLKFALWWALALIALLGAVMLGAGWWRRRRAAQESAALTQMLTQESERAVSRAQPSKRAEVDALRRRMAEAIAKIKGSRLGERSGRAALYELPWYMVIGNPAAGKSSAIVNSGLQFPFADQGGNIIQGIGGTRNCDWFFTTEGILLDTAGRYAVEDEDRAEWLGFLHLLKRHRPKAPINGIVVAASVQELTQNRPEYGIKLAKQIRARVQELTAELEVFAPVYIVFTKVDLISGFAEFFDDSDAAERARVWGATLPYDADGAADPVQRFDEHFDRLYEGLRELSVARMSLYRGEKLGAGVLTFPLEFAAVRPALRAFVATLFEDNPFQFKPVFRGYYFTSALQEGRAAGSSSERVADRFGLKLVPAIETPVSSRGGFFLRDLFSKVIFADRALVRQYASRTRLRLRTAGFAASVLAFGLVLAALSWSFVANQRLVTHVEADFAKAVRLQEGRQDMASRFEALELMQDRIEQLQRYREARPIGLGFGLYQGEPLEAKLRAEYFHGVQQLLLKPVAESLESYLAEVNRRSGELTPQQAGGAERAAAKQDAAAQTYRDASPTDVQDAYNALKTYLMLGSRDHVEPGHLNDQLTRFWRVWLENNRGEMPREKMIRAAERMLGFVVAQSVQPDFPLVDTRLALVDQTRDTLRKVVKGQPARERVYAQIKARAATRYPSMTALRIVGDEGRDLIAGSHAIPGTFTREAWEGYVEAAIKEAASKELQSTDWVLKTAARDDLSLEGSPEQIQKALTLMYKTEYAAEWKKFLQGVTVADFAGFDDAVKQLNRLGDPANSPIGKIIDTVYRQTSWDNPSLLNDGLAKAQSGIMDWFRETILRQSPAQVSVNVSTARAEIPMGPVGREFSAIANLVIERPEAKDGSLLKAYLQSLAKLRSRFNQMKTAGDPGPASRQLMMQTLEGSGSELSDALRQVDEQVLSTIPDAARGTIRPLLVRPLMMAFAVIVKPAEQELNRTWAAQVYDPFMRSLSEKYPFTQNARVEAGAAEIAQVFGPEGAVSKFVQTSLGPLVVRRGDTLASRTWADMGMKLAPEFSDNFARFVAPVAGAPTAAGAGDANASGAPQTVFQIQPLPVSGVTEYTLEIDGQVLRYRMGVQDWVNFVWPSGKGAPGARITAVAYDGRTVEVASQPGTAGLERLINTAQKKKRSDGVFEMTWSNNGIAVSVNLRIVSSAQADTSAGASAPQKASNLLGIKLPAVVAGSGT
ncbi:type VI secretion system membrane subunit TssM [Niveibacterium umoris]|uniref:Type VI secretion system protein ImpL n=1 Tax=Niveibacterium umoris TaxID=1193620 RepID=A0A840BLW1_9RHOO|nr:type VI secretion system membrane subunit TssM [Niveibacterium umoris]MBB4012548.1 type VI secretion system protein ImpL [Niveibacterium umoris]